MYILDFLICQAHNGIKLSKILRGFDRILKGVVFSNILDFYGK
jgi:hypothetical protein